MTLQLDETNFALNDQAPDGKLWGRLFISMTDTDTDTGRHLEANVLLTKGDTTTFLDYEKQARVEAKKLLIGAAELL